jgi:hypothetical protein
MSRETLWKTDFDQYEYDPKGKWPLIQRACFWVLRKLKAFARFGATEIRRTELDLDKLVEAVMRNRADVMLLYNKQAKYLVVGMDRWYELTGAGDRNYLTFEVPHSFHARIGYDNKPLPQLFAGLKVIVVPWIDGMFVLPELE